MVSLQPLTRKWCNNANASSVKPKSTSSSRSSRDRFGLAINFVAILFFRPMRRSADLYLTALDDFNRHKSKLIERSTVATHASARIRFLQPLVLDSSRSVFTTDGAPRMVQADPFLSTASRIEHDHKTNRIPSSFGEISYPISSNKGVFWTHNIFRDNSRSNGSEFRVLIFICLGRVPQIHSLLQIHPNVWRGFE